MLEAEARDDSNVVQISQEKMSTTTCRSSYDKEEKRRLIRTSLAASVMLHLRVERKYIYLFSFSTHPPTTSLSFSLCDFR